MHALSSRAAVAPLVTILLLFPSPLEHRVDANEFPSQRAPQRQSPYAQPLRKPEAIADRARAADIRVYLTPNVVGQRIGDAKAKLESAGFRAGSEAAEPTRAARPGTVVRQSPAAGTPIKPGTVISLWVATSPPRDDGKPDDVGSPIGERRPPRGDIGIKVPDGPRFVVVPDLARRSVPEAVSILEQARLRLGTQRREESDATPDTVVGQLPPAGHRVPIGAPVSIAVAAPILVTVPDLRGRSSREAAALLDHNRLRAGTVHREESEGPAGETLSQTPPAGARVPVGTAVSIVIATPLLVEVPDLLGRPLAAATDALQRHRLGLGPQQREESDAVAGTVVSQAPGAGRRVPVGSSIAITVAEKMLVTVPDVRGTSEAEAVARLQSSRLRTGERSRHESDNTAGTIVNQRPVPGTRVSPGTPVSLSVAVPILVSVPDLSGRTDDEARQLLRERQLVLGERQRQESDARPGSITRQSPRADTRVARGTRIDVVVAVAPPITPVTLPPSPPQRPEVTQPAPQKPSDIDRGRTPTAPPAPPTMVSPVAPAAPVAPVAPAAPAAPAPPTTVSSTLRREDPAPVASATPALRPPTAPPVRRFDWLYSMALGAALVLVLGGARAALHRYSGRRTSSPASVPVPTVDFAPHWDVGTMRIGPAGALCAGSGLRLVSGIDMDPAHLDADHIVDVVNVAGESR